MLFDTKVNEVLSSGDFGEFVEFVWSMRWVESQEGSAAPVAQAPAPDEGEFAVTDMLDMMRIVTARRSRRISEVVVPGQRYKDGSRRP